jgi:PAS domain-containing protein
MADRRLQVDTFFAPAPRVPLEVVEAQAALIARHPLVAAALAPSPGEGLGLVLNEHRQILAANQAALDALGARSVSDLLGRRPGEAFDCVHAPEGPSGCGTASGCQVCGAVIAVLGASRQHREVQGQLQLERGPERTAARFEVIARPLRVAGLDLVAVVLRPQ